MDDPIGVAKYRDVGIVRRKDVLIIGVSPLQSFNQSRSNECIVEVIFRLVEDQRIAVLPQQDRQDCGASLAD
ncbi:hypothetical protein ASE12_04335 [Aeromicrobium sp. Root236]|nr:hypothetical protein ASE12_04335 [Aeromicrobium sp. Root236]